MNKVLSVVVIFTIIYFNPWLLILAAIGAYFWFKFKRKSQTNSSTSNSFNFNLFSSGSSSSKKENNSSSQFRSLNSGGGKRFGLSDEEKRKKELEDEAYFYRKNDGPRWKIESADKQLGRATWESRYEDEKYGR